MNSWVVFSRSSDSRWPTEGHIWSKPKLAIITMKSRELGPEHSTHSVVRYASAYGPTNPGHEIFFEENFLFEEKNIFWRKIFFEEKIFLDKNFFWPKNFLGKKFFFLKKNIFEEKILKKKFFWRKIFWGLGGVVAVAAAIFNRRPGQNVRFLFWSANTQNLKLISHSSTELWPKIGFDHIWRSVGHLESDDLDKKSLDFVWRYQHTNFEVNISIQYRVMAQNRFRPYMAVSRPSWIEWPRKNNSAVHF